MVHFWLRLPGFHDVNSLENRDPKVLERFADMGMELEPTDEGLTATAPARLRSIDVATLPYPGIATDYKPLIITMLAVADGGLPLLDAAAKAVNGVAVFRAVVEVV